MSLPSLSSFFLLLTLLTESEIVIRRLEEEGHYEVVFAPLNNGVYLVVLGILAPNKAFIQGNNLLLYQNLLSVLFYIASFYF